MPVVSTTIPTLTLTLTLPLTLILTCCVHYYPSWDREAPLPLIRIRVRVRVQELRVRVTKGSRTCLKTLLFSERSKEPILGNLGLQALSDE